MGLKKIKNQKLKTINKQNSAPEHIAIESNKNIKILNVAKITYLEASGSSSSIYLEDETMLKVSKNLGFYEKLLDSKYFLRVHRSYIINIAYLENITRDSGGQYCVLKENCIIPISNRKFPSLKKLLHY